VSFHRQINEQNLKKLNCRISDVFLFNESFVLTKGESQYRHPNALSIESTSFYRYDWCFGKNGQIIIHNPRDPPQVRRFMETDAFYESGKLQQFVITPKITTTGPELRRISAKR
jgi:hypothetical protein